MFDPELYISVYWPVMTLKLNNIKTKAKKNPTKYSIGQILIFSYIPKD
jgi:hypothetical protein